MFFKNRSSKNLCIACLTLICAPLIGVFLMFLAYCIPTNPITFNVKNSLAIYQVEQKWYRWAPPYFSSQLENFGDAYLLSKAVFPVTDPLKDSMLGAKCETQRDEHPVIALFDCLETADKSNTYRAETARYWSGSLTLLKPLLTIFTLSEIRILSMILQFFLLCLLVIQLHQKGGYKLLLPFLLGVCILNPISCALSISYAPLYCITLLSCLILLKYNLYNSPKYWYFFLLIGIITIFFDQFTYILVPLGFPLILFVLLNNEKTFLKMKKIIIASVSWGIGFSGMWLGKWLASSLITGRNIFIEAFNQMKFRVGEDVYGKKITSLDAVQENLDALFACFPAQFYLFLLLGITVWIILNFIREYKIQFQKSIIFPLLLIGTYPFIYCAIIKNAAFIHQWMFYRMFALTVLGIIYIIVYSFKKNIISK